MRAKDAWKAMRDLPILDYANAFGATKTLILAPHPDDESLGCGGMIAEACARGLHPRIVVLTDGSMSHPHSSSYPARRLSGLRERELLDATALLGVPAEEVFFMRYVDTQAPRSGADLQEAANALAQLIRSSECASVVVSWEHDPHCDHAAAAAIAAVACRATGTRLLAYPIWGWRLPPEMLIDTAPICGFQLDISQHVHRKRQAILAHASQYAGIINDDPEGFQLPADFIEHFLAAPEVYIEVGNQAATPV
jgi:LmbE family N-acetylglucosaminyl deacetylase